MWYLSSCVVSERTCSPALCPHAPVPPRPAPLTLVTARPRSWPGCRAGCLLTTCLFFFFSTPPFTPNLLTFPRFFLLRLLSCPLHDHLPSLSLCLPLFLSLLPSLYPFFSLFLFISFPFCPLLSILFSLSIPLSFSCYSPSFSFHISF